ncbi:hypothetical protein L3X38_036704 [Prunus dulcis]|uniref:Uncharacterized protein n=1 Tax=Prunus dulcis TaxID=3755 RepID=A0AAD4V413_PRUDU|nr:hypothetical protein L3X38_036704 [Prunus dulcis]
MVAKVSERAREISSKTLQTALFRGGFQLPRLRIEAGMGWDWKREVKWFVWDQSCLKRWPELEEIKTGMLQFHQNLPRTKVNS